MRGHGMNRRGFIVSMAALLSTPAIIRTPGLLMPVKPLTRITSGSHVIYVKLEPKPPFLLASDGTEIPLYDERGLPTREGVAFFLSVYKRLSGVA